MLRDRLRAQIRRLSALLLERKRAEFFDQIDHHRARGIPTDIIRSKALEGRTARSLTDSGAAIAQFLEAGDPPADRPRNIRWMELLLQNLRGTDLGITTAKKSQFQYLLYGALLATAFNLTRYTAERHGNELSLSRLFRYPARTTYREDGKVIGSEA